MAIVKLLMDKNYNSKNIYGSELSVLKLAETLTDIYEVYIFVNI